jgi:hypothetical protein
LRCFSLRDCFHFAPQLLAASASGLVGALALATSTYNVYLQRLLEIVAAAVAGPRLVALIGAARLRPFMAASAPSRGEVAGGREQFIADESASALGSGARGVRLVHFVASTDTTGSALGSGSAQDSARLTRVASPCTSAEGPCQGEGRRFKPGVPLQEKLGFLRLREGRISIFSVSGPRRLRLISGLTSSQTTRSRGRSRVGAEP